MFVIVEQRATHTPQRQLRPGGRESQVLYCLGRFTTEMDHHNIRPVPDRIACRPNAATEIDLFIIEKEAFIKIANLFEDCSTEDGKRARRPLHHRGLQW